MHGIIVAIDGPSGSGKSSVSKKVAASLGLAYLDTGAMYRALCWYCLTNNIDMDDHQLVAKQLPKFGLDVGTDPGKPVFTVSGHDVSEAIRESVISKNVSKVATNLVVRQWMKERQQFIIAEHAATGIIAEGRDITTVVAPNADVRILLTADPKARVNRRAEQTIAMQTGTTKASVNLTEAAAVDQDLLTNTKDEVIRRDADDSKVSEFMTAAPGVRVLDSSHNTFEQTVAQVISLIELERDKISV